MTSAAEPVGLVCVNYGSSRLLDVDFAHLAACPAVRGVVVDNFSSDFERERVRELAERRGWSLVTPDGNGGFGAGVNLGIAHAAELGCATFVVINPDASMTVQALERLVQHVQAADVPTLAAPRILRPDGSVWFAGSDLYLADGRIRSAAKRARFASSAVQPWLSGAVLAFTAMTWELVGGFDEDFFLYWEDVDLSWRLARLGGRLDVVDDVTATHAEGGTQTERGLQRAGQAKSHQYYFFNIRNRLLFGAKHLDGPTWRQWLTATPRVSWEILLQGGRRQLLSREAPLRPLITGVIDGLRRSRTIRRNYASTDSSGPVDLRRRRSR